ncbi:hypothetical protein I3842_07G157700 [Carya illinoinensis]|uniref:Uncharacterized protein n=1 Tax=Carya illinoinensis TaxID=32201 RepID=A0A922EJJ8_CARIL|nr:hypothetical protein I3842_07G157700 [Carya illinoinensis]
MESNEPGNHTYEKYSIVRPSMEKFTEDDSTTQANVAASLSTTSVSNGCVDFRERTADKQTTGGWKASPFIIVNEVAERLAFFAIAVNMATYLVIEMRQSLPSAATYVTDWIGAAYVLTLLGAFLADAYLGRFKTIFIFSCVYAVGMVLLTLSASIDSLRPAPCTQKPCIKATDSQTAFLYGALGLIALGTGDQFDEADEEEVQKKFGFFNWFFLAINMGALLGITLMVYIQEKKGWVWGFGVPTAAMPMGIPFGRFLQVIVASTRNHFRGVEVGREDQLYEVKTKESDILRARKLPHTAQYSYQVEELKSFIRILPVWASTIALSISYSQLSTFFVSQARRAPFPFFSAINALILVPIYEKLVVPFLRKRNGHPRGMTSLQLMGIGLFISIFAMASAALVKKRRDDSNPLSMSVFWLFPQFFLIGSAEVFTYVGQMEFFYDEATDGTRSICSAIFLSEIGIGSWLSTALVKIIERATGGEERGWLRNDLNKSRLDYFYWILTGINLVNLLVYLWVAWSYKGRGADGSHTHVFGLGLGTTGQHCTETDRRDTVKESNEFAFFFLDCTWLLDDASRGS